MSEFGLAAWRPFDMMRELVFKILNNLRGCEKVFFGKNSTLSCMPMFHQLCTIILSLREFRANLQFLA